jgi:hypothetical protein
MSRHALPGLVLLLAALVASSGCINPVQTGSGVVVQEFTPGFSEVYPGEPITFFLKFKNIGSVEAEEVFAELLGLDEDWAASSKGLGTILNNEMLPQETQCQYPNMGNHYTMKPPDPFYGTEGETATCTWKYRAPSIPGGFGVTYPLTARLFYNYRTGLVKSFTILSSDELMRYNQQGKTLPSSTVSSTSSPITITAEARNPVRFWESSITFPIAITFSNTGGGMVCLKDQCKKTKGQEWNQLVFSIEEISNGITVDCFGREGTPLDVWPGRDNTIVCDVTVSDTSRITGHEERTIGISADYSYFTDAEASITVL